MSGTLNVTEILYSIQGETTRAGRPCTLIRLTGCNLKCSWCDTEYAKQDGRAMSLGEILSRVARRPCKLVAVTGGEPMLQPHTPELLCALCDAGYEVLLETNGSLDVSGLDPRVARIVDFKCPSSGQADSNLWANADALGGGDEVKFVIADRNDYEFARAAATEHQLAARCAVCFSPVWGRLDPACLADWILADGLPVRLSIQLHKVLWPDRSRGV